MISVKNPIISGFYPDPSICRVEDTFYLVNSTFAYFPGVPIFKSKNLVNWEQIGNILNRCEQVPLKGCEHSNGIYAPTIRYHEGVFYMITTNISGGGNFYVTADNPEGPWSEPHFLGEKEADGIDPSLFFDTNGRCYYVGARGNSKGWTVFGDNEIYLQELDLEKKKLVGECYVLWNGALRDVVWAEGPHLYKKDNYYYLMIAEGGTGPEHCVTIARSEALIGPYTGNPKNPILTHRHLGMDSKIRFVGHADLVEDGKDNWYMVMLATRPFHGTTNLGRETFLAQVEWEDGWPVVNRGYGMLRDQFSINMEPCKIIEREDTCHFYEDKLPFHFMTLRNPANDMYILPSVGKAGGIGLKLQKESLKDLASPSYIGVRQKDFNFYTATRLFFEPEAEGESAGLALVQSNLYHIRYVITKDHGKAYYQVIFCRNGVDEILVSREKTDDVLVILSITAREQKADFYFQEGAGRFDTDVKASQLLIENVSIGDLSTEVAGGFVGTTMGIYASGEGSDGSRYALFEWFSYKGIDTCN